MTIRFSCECGQPLAVRDEFAGRRVRCSGCNEARLVPSPEAEDEPEQPALLQFTCEDCGKAIQAKAEHAGKKTKCPGCGLILSIPVAASAARPAAVQAARPRPTRAPALEDDRDEDLEEDERPRRRSIRKKGHVQRSKVGLWIGIAAGLLLLVGGGVAAWLLLGGSKGTGMAEFDMVPRDAAGFMSIRVADLLKTEGGKKMYNMILAQQPGLAQEMDLKIGLRPEEIERVTIITSDPLLANVWAIFRTVRDYDRNKLIGSLGRSTEKKHEGKTYYSGEKEAMILVDARTFVVGTQSGIVECLGMPRKAVAGPLGDAVARAEAGGQHTVVAMNGRVVGLLKALASQQLGLGGAGLLAGFGQPPQQGGKPLAIEAARSYTLTTTMKDDYEYQVVADFPDPARADAAVKEIEEFVSAAKGFLLLGGVGMLGGDAKQNLPGVDLKFLLDMFTKVLNQIKPKKDGSKVSVGMTITSKDFDRWIEEAQKVGPPGGQRFR